MTYGDDSGQPQYPQQGYGQFPPQPQQYAQGQPWQPQRYDPGSHQRRIQDPPQDAPWQQPPYPQQGSQTWPQGQPWQQPGYGQQPYMPPQQQPPRKKRHWVRNTFLGLAGFIVLIVIIAIAANGGSNGTPAAGGGAARPAHPTAAAVTAAPQSALLAGNAHPKYPGGVPRQVSVVYQAPIHPQSTGTLVPIVFRNNTSAAIAHVDVAAPAKDSTGKIVASGSSQGTDPSTVQPGQWAFAYIYFEPGTDLAANDTLSFSFQTTPASTDSFNTAALQVPQANLSGSSIAGGVRNTTGHPVQGPISVHAYCLNSAGDPTSVITGFTSNSSGNLAPDATDSFQLDLYDQSCPSFLVGASGYYS